MWYVSFMSQAPDRLSLLGTQFGVFGLPSLNRLLLLKFDLKLKHLTTEDQSDVVPTDGFIKVEDH